MKKILLTLACTSIFSASAFAQQDTFACQYIQNAGLAWKNGNWQTTAFILRKPFFLTTIDGSLNIESVEKALDTFGVVCTSGWPKLQNCISAVGVSLIFNPVLGVGGVSMILGAAGRDVDEKKDSLSVSPFNCVKM